MEIKRKKILVLTSSFPRWAHGSVGSFIVELNHRLLEKYDITVLAPHAAGAADHERLDGMDVYRFRYWFPGGENLCYDAGLLANLSARPWRYLQLPVFIIAWIFAAVRLARRIRPDFIHAHWIVPAGFIAALIKSWTNIPFFLTVHGSDIMKLTDPVFRALYRYTLRHAAGVTAVSSIMQQRLQQLIPADSHYHVMRQAMGVDAGLFERHGPVDASGLRGNPAILFVGWLDDNKGLEYLLQALPKVIESHPDTVLHVIGEGPRRREFEQYAMDARLRGRVVFHGLVPHEMMPGIYHSASMLVLPSLSEGVPVSVLEAQMSGCPVVATNVGGTPDIVDNGITGLLVPPRDPDAIARAMIQVLTDDALRSRLISAAHDSAQRFDWSAVTRSFMDYFEHSFFLKEHEDPRNFKRP